MKERNSYEEHEREEMEKTIDKLTLFDDDLMSAVFEHNIEATELLLRIILKKKMHVIYVKGQEQLKNPSICSEWLNRYENRAMLTHEKLPDLCKIHIFSRCQQ